jgi:uncharacterized tellurite resistance protein B-like protein
MVALPLEVSSLDNLQVESDFIGMGADEAIFLTPYLTLACALLYMMASDGDLGAQESSHLQGVLGGDDKVLAYALRYVQTVSIDQFFKDAPEVLSTKDKWCILVNVCDALLSDGHSDAQELALFARMLWAFDISEKAFQPYLKTLKLKNDKSVLGQYTGVKVERQPMTPHFALAVSLLYMLTADGSIGAEEVGQLEAVIGEFDGLQTVALKYVRSVKLAPFLAEASVALKPEQKTYILTNVCDSMMADGLVARLEDKVFVSMMKAFGFDEKSFAFHQHVFETKNFKPFECNFKNRGEQVLDMSQASQAGVTIKHDLSVLADHLKVDLATLDNAANQGAWVSPDGGAAMSNFITRTMQDNIQNVTDDFGSQESVAKVAQNATDALNVQKISLDEDVKNRQQIDRAAALDNNQKIDAASAERNRQQIKSDSQTGNQQVLPADLAAVNRALIESETRMQNIQEVAHEVGQRLDHFERVHFDFLQVGKAQRYDDSFALVDEGEPPQNRQFINTAVARLGVVFFAQVPHAGVGEEAAWAKSQIASESGVAAVVQMAGATPSHSDAPARVFSKAKQYQPFAHVGTASAVPRRFSRLNYVQLVTAFLILTFAAPISTQTLSAQTAVGRLVVQN